MSRCGRAACTAVFCLVASVRSKRVGLLCRLLLVLVSECAHAIVRTGGGPRVHGVGVQRRRRDALA